MPGKPPNVTRGLPRSGAQHHAAHQSGLGDLYDSRPARHSARIMDNNRMGQMRHPWGSGDLAGLRQLSVPPRAACGR